MARRSSARLRARQQSITPQPQRVLDAVSERDELPNNTPGAFPGSVSPEVIETTPTKLAKHIENVVSSPMKSAKQYDTSTATPKTARPSYPNLEHVIHDTDMTSPQAATPATPQTCPPKSSERHEAPAIAVQTPGRLAASRQQQAPQDHFQFTFRAQSLELSNEAQRMMAEKREEAAKIKQQLSQEHDSRQNATAINSRKMAKGKPRVGRFSDVHMSNFRKMDSIAEQPTTTKVPALKQPASTVKNVLKRTKSKADLTPSAKKQAPESRNVPCSAPPKYSRPVEDDHQPASPTKRVKRTANDDVTTSRPGMPISPKSPSTPKRKNALGTHSQTPSRGNATAPTQSSIQRNANTKSAHVSQIPTMTQSPSKSPSKALYPDLTKPAPSVLLQSPTRPPPSERKHDATPQGPSLAQSPIRPVHQRLYQDSKPDPEAKTPMLHRSPVRMPAVHHTEVSGESPRRTPLLHRSPVRPVAAQGPSGEAKPVNHGHVSRLTERFNQLRRSPVKSILRTPQRKYTDDPIKIANGTHQATPSQPDHARLPVPMTEPVRKHVNFSASTKDDDGHVFKKSVMPIDIKTIAQNTFSYPKLPVIHDEEHVSPESASAPKKFNRRKTLGAEGLGDFTFRASQEMQFSSTDEARFSAMPAVPQISSLAKARQQSIRQVSASSSLSDGTIDQLGRLSLPTKKRKFIEDQENMQLDGQAPCKELNDDEEMNEARPSKRARPNVNLSTQTTTNRPSMHAAKRASVVPGKPSMVTRPSHKPATLTQARLAALAMPKRR